eukprot:6492384-Amphidinium_carterae.10
MPMRCIALIAVEYYDAMLCELSASLAMPPPQIFADDDRVALDQQLHSVHHLLLASQYVMHAAVAF